MKIKKASYNATSSIYDVLIKSLLFRFVNLENKVPTLVRMQKDERKRKLKHNSKNE